MSSYEKINKICGDLNMNVLNVFYGVFAVLAVWGIAQAWLSQTRTETIHPIKAFIHLLAFYLFYLLW